MICSYCWTQSRAVVRFAPPDTYFAQARRMLSRCPLAVVSSHSSTEVAPLRWMWGSFWNLEAARARTRIRGLRWFVRPR